MFSQDNSQHSNWQHVFSYYIEKTCWQLLCWGLSRENMVPVIMLEIILRKHAANYYVGGYLEKTWPVTILGIILRKHAANYYVGNYLGSMFSQDNPQHSNWQHVFSR
jgi:hypothetical protein